MPRDLSSAKVAQMQQKEVERSDGFRAEDGYVPRLMAMFTTGPVRAICSKLLLQHGLLDPITP